MSRRVAVCLLVLAVLAVPPAGGSGIQTAAERPPGTVTGVEIQLGGSRGHSWGRVSWTVVYPARSEEEAARAANETLAVDWFRGAEHVRAAVGTHTGSGVTSGGTDVTQVPSDDGSDYGRIVVNYRATWEGLFAGNRSQVVIGPGFATELSPGDSFQVHVPEPWEAESANTERLPAGEVYDYYNWTIGEDPTPRVVFDESVLGPEPPSSDGERVAGPGPALALLAVVVAAVLRRYGRA